MRAPNFDCSEIRIFFIMSKSSLSALFDKSASCHVQFSKNPSEECAESQKLTSYTVSLSALVDAGVDASKAR